MNKKKLKRSIAVFQEADVKHKLNSITFFVVLVQPETAANIGSISRVMKNFNFKNLIIFNPTEHVNEIHSYQTQGYAMHGKDILFNSEIIILRDSDNHLTEFENFLRKFDLVIATTAKGRHYRNITRTSIFPEDLDLPTSKRPLKIAILFGKESRGLTNEEVSLSDISVRIPTHEDYPTLNISHACAIILYELFLKTHHLQLGKKDKPIIPADREDRKLLYELINQIISKLKIRTHKMERVLISFKNIFERAFITQKELSLITGVFSKIRSIIFNLKLYDKNSEEN